MKQEWSIFLTARRCFAGKQEVGTYEFGRGINSYGDGPAQTIKITRASQTEAEFIASAMNCLNGLNNAGPAEDRP